MSPPRKYATGNRVQHNVRPRNSMCVWEGTTGLFAKEHGKCKMNTSIRAHVDAHIQCHVLQQSITGGFVPGLALCDSHLLARRWQSAGE